MKSAGLLSLVLVLSLATWFAFSAAAMPLTGPETTLVTGVWLAVILGGNWLWVLSRKKKSAKDGAKK